MCIMEVRRGQRSSTVAQAMAHNVSTVERDLDMFELLLKARGQGTELQEVLRVHDLLREAYSSLLATFGREVVREVEDWEHDHGDHDHGNERVPEDPATQAAMVEAAEHAGEHYAQEARRFMTR